MVQAPEDYAHRGRRLWTALIVFVAASFVLLAYALWSVYREALLEAEGNAGDYAELLVARFEGSLRRIDTDLARLADRIPASAMRADAGAAVRDPIVEMLERFRRGYPEIAAFRVVDARGEVLYSAGSRGPRIDDRLYFRQLREQPGSVTLFSDVLVSRLNGQPAIVAARAIRDERGGFAGAIVAPLEIRHFEQIFDSVRLGPGGALAIRRADNHALVLRMPPLPEAVNQPLGERHPLYERLAQGSRRGVQEFVSEADGVGRIYAYRQLEGYPFYVLAGVAKADILAIWRQRVAMTGAVSLMLFGGLAGVLVGLFRVQQREREGAARLREHRRQLATAQRIAQLGGWEMELKGREVACSEELYRIFEIDPARARLHYDDFLARVHPDDRPRLDQVVGEAIARGRPFQLKHRLLMPDGRIKYLMEIGEPSFAADGAPRKMVGTTQDITGLHRMESQMQLLASAFEHSGEAILITDIENRIITVNPAFTRLTGYAPEEAVGRNPRFLSAGRTTQEEYQVMWKAILRHGFWQGEIWDRRKDGGVYPKWMTVSVIRGEGGEIRYHVAHFTDVSAERAAEAQLQHIAHHDMLTGLLNRLSLNGRLDQALAAARREGDKVAVMFIDLDRFKVINDTLGHHVGDELLVQVARRLRAEVRDSDVVARLGGDEFIVMLSGIEHSGAAALVAEKLVRSIGDPYTVEGHDLYATPSIGIALFPTDGDDRDTLMKNADAAMYHAKAAGRNNFQFFDARMNDAVLERLKLEHSLRQALGREEFMLHFQPLVELESGRIDGVEALVRWRHPEKGMIPPGRFIGIAEETGLIQPLGEWIFWTACRQLAEFHAQGFAGLRMSINISAMQLRNGNLPVIARGAIDAFALPPATLVFEITESVAMQQPEETVRILDLLHDMGIGLAIDDFGTGYSSLSYLRLFPIRQLKLDRSFVQEIEQGRDGQVICEATIGLAHNLGLKLVAEGVETEAQRDYLRRRGCDLAQGYLFSPPLPADEVAAFIRRNNG